MDEENSTDNQKKSLYCTDELFGFTQTQKLLLYNNVPLINDIERNTLQSTSPYMINEEGQYLDQSGNVLKKKIKEYNIETKEYEEKEIPIVTKKAAIEAGAAPNPDCAFYAFYINVYLMTIQELTITPSEDKAIIKDKVYRRVDRRIDINEENYDIWCPNNQLKCLDGVEFFFDIDMPISNITLVYPTEEETPHFETWMCFIAGEDNPITFPNDSTYINETKPDIEADEAWEISIIDKVVIGAMNGEDEG